MKIALRIAILTFLLMVFIMGCTGKPTVTPFPVLETPVLTETPSPTPVPNGVLLVSAPEDDPSIVDQINTEIETLSNQASLVLEKRSNFQVGDLSSDMKVVVFTDLPPNLNDLLNSGGNIQFVVVSSQDVTAAPNLTVIRLHPEFSAFIAGYVAEMISTDWRAAGLIPSDISNSDLIQQAFQNGGRYWCGTCPPDYPPYAKFPLVAAMPASSDSNTWRAAVDQLETNRIYTLLAWDLSTFPDVLQYASNLNVLTEQGIFMHPILLGNQNPPDNLQQSWAVTLTSDAASALPVVWADLMIGKGGRTVDAGVKMSNINEDLFSIGKQRLADETIQMLILGLIDPLNP